MKKLVARVFKFFREERNEMRKVHWPNRKELGTYTMVVMFTIIIVGILFGILDFSFQNLLKLVIQ